MNNTRKFENFHILLWLLKDTSWLMGWKSFGIFMVFPTIFFAVLITYKSAGIISEVIHNLAVTLWICANSYWMIMEFIGMDEQKIYAIIPFALGIFILLSYYVKSIMTKIK